MGTKRYTPSNLKSVSFQLTGLDDMVKRIRDAGNNIEAVVAEAVEAGAAPVYQDIKAWVEKHKLTGATEKGLTLSEVKRDGGRIWVEVGISTEDAPLAWHAVFVEYGTPTMKADPGIRPAFSGNRAKVRTIQKKILVKGGVPTA